VLSRGAENSAQLAAARARIAELETEIARLSARDPLVSSLLTLTAFRAQLELDVQRAHRYSRPLALAILDIDHFRRLNMARGYGTGDLVLAGVGRLLTESTRAHDLVCRAGGDEFVLLFPETELDEAHSVLERILIDLEQLDAADQVGVSMSGGLAALRLGENADDMLARAQHALAVARDEGGARIHVSRETARESPTEDAGVAATTEVVAALAEALEERDNYTGEHSESVVDLAAHVAEALGLEPHEITTIRSAALLHNFGKVGIPDEILHKAGPLDDDEWRIMRQHPAIGERILRAIPGMGRVARIVRHEHERWDGTGYPDGLAGDAIPIGARIIHACDAYHAMTSDRPYRAALSHHMAMAELTTNAGSQFDPKVIEALVGYLYDRRQSGLAAV
jgi:diguanylate cyclase (GGDEF)-like protein